MSKRAESVKLDPEAVEVLDEINRLTEISEKLIAKSQPSAKDHDTLSRAGAKLATLNSTLGEFVAYAKREAAGADHYFRTRREEIKVERVKEGDAIGVADSKKDIETKEDREIAIDQQYIADLMTIKMSRTTDVIDQIKSRLSFVKWDERNSGGQNV